MTREQIIADLMTLVERIGNELPPSSACWNLQLSLTHYTA